mgnify:CR=1 FL=1
MFRIIISFSRIKQGLGRNTSLIQADTAQTSFFEQYNTQSCLSGSFGSSIPCGTSTDDCNLIFHGIYFGLISFYLFKTFNRQIWIYFSQCFYKFQRLIRVNHYKTLGVLYFHLLHSYCIRIIRHFTDSVYTYSVPPSRFNFQNTIVFYNINGFRLRIKH